VGRKPTARRPARKCRYVQPYSGFGWYSGASGFVAAIASMFRIETAATAKNSGVQAPRHGSSFRPRQSGASAGIR
jgi:hypothetical protein